MAERPTERIMTKHDGDAKWTELAAIWERDGKRSVTFSQDVVAGTRAMIFKNEPRQPEQSAGVRQAAKPTR
jgi:hypothetical protein